MLSLLWYVIRAVAAFWMEVVLCVPRYLLIERHDTASALWGARGQAQVQYGWARSSSVHSTNSGGAATSGRYESTVQDPIGAISCLRAERKPFPGTTTSSFQSASQTVISPEEDEPSIRSSIVSPHQLDTSRGAASTNQDPPPSYTAASSAATSPTLELMSPSPSSSSTLELSLPSSHVAISSSSLPRTIANDLTQQQTSADVSSAPTVAWRQHWSQSNSPNAYRRHRSGRAHALTGLFTDTGGLYLSSQAVGEGDKAFRRASGDTAVPSLLYQRRSTTKRRWPSHFDSRRARHPAGRFGFLPPWYAVQARAQLLLACAAPLLRIVAALFHQSKAPLSTTPVVELSSLPSPLEQRTKSHSPAPGVLYDATTQASPPRCNPNSNAAPALLSGGQSNNSSSNSSTGHPGMEVQKMAAFLPLMSHGLVLPERPAAPMSAAPVVSFPSTLSEGPFISAASQTINCERVVEVQWLDHRAPPGMATPTTAAASPPQMGGYVSGDAVPVPQVVLLLCPSLVQGGEQSHVLARISHLCTLLSLVGSWRRQLYDSSGTGLFSVAASMPHKVAPFAQWYAAIPQVSLHLTSTDSFASMAPLSPSFPSTLSSPSASSSSLSSSSSVCPLTLEDVARAIDQLRSAATSNTGTTTTTTAAGTAMPRGKDAAVAAGVSGNTNNGSHPNKNSPAGPLYIFLVGWSEAASPLLEYVIAFGEAARADGMLCISHSLSSTFPLLSQTAECAPLPVPYYTHTLSRLTSGPARLMLLLIRLQLIADGLSARQAQRRHDRRRSDVEKKKDSAALRGPQQQKRQTAESGLSGATSGWTGISAALQEFQEVRQAVNEAFSQIDRVSMLWARQQDANSGGGAMGPPLKEEKRAECPLTASPSHPHRPLPNAVSEPAAQRRQPLPAVLQPRRLMDNRAAAMNRDDLNCSPVAMSMTATAALSEEEEQGTVGEEQLGSIYSSQHRLHSVPPQLLTVPSLATISSSSGGGKWRACHSADDVMTSCMLQGWSPRHPAATGPALPGRRSFPVWPITSPTVSIPLRVKLWSPISSDPPVPELQNGGGGYVSRAERCQATPPPLSSIDAAERISLHPVGATPVMTPFFGTCLEDTAEAMEEEERTLPRRPSILYAMAEGRPDAAQSPALSAEVRTASDDWTSKATALLQLRVRSAQHAALVDRIGIPTLLLHARDDPVVPPSSIPFSLLQRNACITTVLTRRGSHATFVEHLSDMWTRPELIVEAEAGAEAVKEMPRETRNMDEKTMAQAAQWRPARPSSHSLNGTMSTGKPFSRRRDGIHRRRRDDLAATAEVSASEAPVRVRITGTTWLEQLLFEYVASAVLTQPARR